MIDTVILSIPRDKITTYEMSYEKVPSWDLQSQTKIYSKHVKNPSERDMEGGLYFPRLTLIRRKNRLMEWDSHVKIEFSAPKLLYKNNVEELEDSQFGEVVRCLKDRLFRMGLNIENKDLVRAEVRAVHYSKNIELKHGYTSQYVIGELNKINLNKRFDLTRARYMNDGQSLYAYTQSHSLVIYDKIADLIRGKKRSIDKEQSAYQMSLFTPLAKRPEPLEILRIEARLSQKRKMNSVFKKLGFTENPTFKDVFSTKISQAVVWDYWETMLSTNMTLLFAHSLSSKDLLKQVLITERKMKVKEAIYRAGLMWLVQEGNGMRELRTILSKRANDRTWYRIAIDARKTGTALSKLKPREWCDQIIRALKTYKPIHI